MRPEEWRNIGDAIVLWTGFDQHFHPLRRDELITEHYGHETAAKLLPIIHKIANDFYSSNARYIAANLVDMEKLSSQQIITKYPELPKEAVRALAWCYTFDHK